MFKGFRPWYRLTIKHLVTWQYVHNVHFLRLLAGNMHDFFFFLTNERIHWSERATSTYWKFPRYLASDGALNKQKGSCHTCSWWAVFKSVWYNKFLLISIIMIGLNICDGIFEMLRVESPGCNSDSDLGGWCCNAKLFCINLYYYVTQDLLKYSPLIQNIWMCSHWEKL